MVETGCLPVPSPMLSVPSVPVPSREGITRRKPHFLPSRERTSLGTHNPLKNLEFSAFPTLPPTGVLDPPFRGRSVPEARGETRESDPRHSEPPTFRLPNGDLT